MTHGTLRWQQRPPAEDLSIKVDNDAPIVAWGSGLRADLLSDRHLTITAVLLSLILFSVELTNFTLSIDEESQAFATQIPLEWFRQGRWGMGILTAIFPPFQALPIIATAIFCLGISVSALLCCPLIAKPGFESYVFVVIFIANPLWPHLAEYNTLSWGIGIGMVALALSARAATSDGLIMILLSIACLTFAISIYQTACLAFLPLSLAATLSSRLLLPGEGSKFPIRRIGRILGIFLASGITCWIVGRLILTFLGATMSGYTAMFFRPDLFINPATRVDAIFDSAHTLWLLLSGQLPEYHGIGTAFLILPWLGLALFPALRFFSLDTSQQDRLRGTLLVSSCLGSAATAVFIAAGSIPFRSMLMLPIICGVGAVNVARYLPRAKWPIGGLLAVAVFFSWWNTVSLFSIDQRARDADATTATIVISRLADLNAGSATSMTTPFTVIGSFPMSPERSNLGSSWFGFSFFEAPVQRVLAYLELRGARQLSPVAPATLEDHREELDAMPVWPAPNSISRVDGVIVLKLSPVPEVLSKAIG